MRISDWSSDVCSSDLGPTAGARSFSPSRRMAPKLGILAGGSMLPRQLAETCLKSGRDVFLIAFNGHTEPRAVEGLPHAWARLGAAATVLRSEEHTSELQSLMRISYAVFCLKKKTNKQNDEQIQTRYQT